MTQNSPVDSVDRRIAALAARQHGVVARRQLDALGCSRGATEHRIRAGRLLRLHRGVFAVGHRELTTSGHALAAVLACGGEAVLSHLSAGGLWELRPWGGRYHVTVASGGGRARRGNIEVHRTVWLPADHVVVHRGVPITTVARTLIDLAGVVSGPALARAVEAAEALRLLDVRAVRAVLDAAPGRPGARALCELVEDPITGFTRSDLEARFLTTCREREILPPVVNARVGRFEVDFVWPAQRLVAELDGFRYHGTRAGFERDRARDAELLARGYRVLRFTHRQMIERDAWVADRVSAALGTSLGE